MHNKFYYRVSRTDNMNKKILVPIFGLVLFMLIPNPVMGQVTNNSWNTPKQTYIESHYGIKTCADSFQWKFLCDRVDILIQQNDQIISFQNTIKSQNDQLINLGKAQVCMTGQASHSNLNDYALRFGVNCNIGKS